MRIMITGANGFVGSYLAQRLSTDPSIGLLATGRQPSLSFEASIPYREADIADPSALENVVKDFQPGLIVHSAAMTRVDACELNENAAYVANVEGTRNLLKAAEEVKAHVIFLSTDFIFDGETGMYREEDAPHPLNYYGVTKLIGELATQDYPFGWTIVRTVLVYGRPLVPVPNILVLLDQKLSKGEEFKLVNDQFRTPTYVEDLASAIETMIRRGSQGIFHISGDTLLTPYDMGLALAKLKGYDPDLIMPVSTGALKEPAKRPPRTGFNIGKAKSQLGYTPLSFEEGLRLAFSSS